VECVDVEWKSMAGMTTSDTHDKVDKAILPAQLALRPTWRPEVSTFKAQSAALIESDVVPDFAKLVSNINRDATTAGVEDLCLALRIGGVSTREAAHESGAVESAGALLARDDDVPVKAMEALWLLIDDHDSWQNFSRCGGQQQVLKLAREKGSQDASFACSSLRLLAETLYFEDRDSMLWNSADLDFLIDALGWALTADASEAHAADLACALLCDIAALWVRRSSRVGIEVAKALVGIIPLLLQKMASRADDMVFLLHGCRLLHALANCSSHWPEDLRRPTLAALLQLSSVLQGSEMQVAHQGRLALDAVASVSETPPMELMSMD